MVDEQRVTEFGGGVGLKVMDGSTIADLKLIEQIEQVARRDKIACQRCVLPGRAAQDGAMIQYEAADGGPLEVAWTGTYQLLDDHTIEASEVGLFNRFVYDFSLRDGILTLDVISVDDPYPDAFGVQTAIYETLPFTRVP